MNAPVLQDDRIIETVDLLQRRIDDRFPASGLSKLCGQLLIIARQASQRAAWIAKPIRWIRLISCLLALAVLALLVWLISYAAQQAGQQQSQNFFEAIQTVDAALNLIIFLSVGIVFLFSLEPRIKRRRALAAIHELRSIAHVIDMHQLTKDPERALRSWTKTKNSPTYNMTSFELHRYLDYCSEMLSLTGKVAALYVKEFDDAESVAAVSELEQLSTGLSRKIWQKIMILQRSREAIEKLEQAQRARQESETETDSADGNNPATDSITQRGDAAEAS